MVADGGRYSRRLHSTADVTGRYSAGRFSSRAHYFRAAALAMRRILLHHAERRRTLKRGGGACGLSLEKAPGADASNDGGLDVIVLNEALERLVASGIDGVRHAQTGWSLCTAAPGRPSGEPDCQ
jgi:hypothetical protein